jgi:hypothetical protein
MGGEGVLAAGVFGGGGINWGGLSGIGSNVFASMIQGPLSAEGRRYAAISNTIRYRAGATRSPRHHWLPQRDQAFFNARGVTNRQIDRLTSPLSEGVHQAIEKYVGPLGGYRDTLVARILDREADLYRTLKPREIMSLAAELRRDIRLSQYKTIGYTAP